MLIDCCCCSMYMYVLVLSICVHIFVVYDIITGQTLYIIERIGSSVMFFQIFDILFLL